VAFTSRISSGFTGKYRKMGCTNAKTMTILSLRSAQKFVLL
jgi:hypothetical protein